MRRPGLAALTAAAVLAAAKAAAAFSVVPPSLRGVAVGPVLLPPLPAAAEKGAADGESAAASSAAAPHVPSPRTGRYQSGAYDRPIVLLGCSGPGNELTRLASSLAQALAPDDAAAPSGAGGTMGPGGGDEDGASWSVLQAVGRAGSAATVLGAEALAAGIEGAEMGGGKLASPARRSSSSIWAIQPSTGAARRPGSSSSGPPAIWPGPCTLTWACCACTSTSIPTTGG